MKNQWQNLIEYKTVILSTLSCSCFTKFLVWPIVILGGFGLCVFINVKESTSKHKRCILVHFTNLNAVHHFSGDVAQLFGYHDQISFRLRNFSAKVKSVIKMVSHFCQGVI